mgnify:CR=1 FL=1
MPTSFDTAEARERPLTAAELKEAWPVLSAEERERLRKEFESLSPEERQKRIDDMRRRRGAEGTADRPRGDRPQE